ncbi:MAG: nucleotide exchange factor GrpE [Planctomycetota bacterium]|jgi:molecular chaperone GrpE
MKRKDKEKTEEKGKAEPVTWEQEEFGRQLQELQAQKDETLAKLQRVSADYANFQKRVTRQIADAIAYEKELIIKTLLPALDNFEHTLANAQVGDNADAFVKGVRIIIIYDQMLDILKSHGVEQIKALGEKFDPAQHEAMMQRAEPEMADDVVLEEFQKGFKLNGRIIRPSKVIVNKLDAERPQEDEPETKTQVDLREQTADDGDTKDTD